MIPAQSDPRWGHFLNNIGNLKVTELATRMVLNRIKLKLSFDNSDSVRKQSIVEVHAFLTKNENVLQNDIKAIFG
jgi:hypothetical protein